MGSGTERGPRKLSLPFTQREYHVRRDRGLVEDRTLMLAVCIVFCVQRMPVVNLSCEPPVRRSNYLVKAVGKVRPPKKARGLKQAPLTERLEHELTHLPFNLASKADQQKPHSTELHKFA